MKTGIGPHIPPATSHQSAAHTPRSTMTEPMRVQQTRFGDPDGNCLEACFATLTGIPLDDIPHFLNQGWFGSYCRWFLDRGWKLDYWLGGLESAPGGYAIASGPAIRGLEHSTVYLDSTLFHDPHPSFSGLVEVTDWMSLTPLGDAS